jgi:hypothetical protein
MGFRLICTRPSSSAVKGDDTPSLNAQSRRIDYGKLWWNRSVSERGESAIKYLHPYSYQNG